MKTEDQVILEKVHARLVGLKTERSSYIPHWQEITNFISPRTSQYFVTDANRGGKMNGEILNETAMLSSRTLQSGLMAGMSSPARPWFLLGPPDPGMKEFGPVKDWLDVVTKKMRDVFSRSNIYSVLPRAYGSMGDYGTAAYGVLDDDKDVIRGYSFPIGSYMLACNSRGNVDTFYREFQMTVRQCVEQFGLENVSRAIRNLWDKSTYDAKIPLLYSVEPNFSRQADKLDSRDKPFLSVYSEGSADKGKALRISGFDEFPILAPRWMVNGEDVYGSNCPGMMALGGVKQLQLMERRGLQALDKFVNGAVEADATLRNTGVDLLPGGVVWRANMGNSPHPGVRRIEQIDPNIFMALDSKMEKVTERIKRCYFEDLMLMFAQSDRNDITAEEVRERHQEKLLVMGPMMEQSNDDNFDPLVDRTFNRMLRKGMFPPPPQELQGKPLRVEYTSIMAQAQKLVGVAAVERFIGFVGQVAQYDESVRDKVDFDQAVDEYAEMTGIPSRMVVPDNQVQETRTARAQSEQAQRTMMAMPAMAQGADAAKTLSETNVQGVNALTRLMTGGGLQ